MWKWQKKVEEVIHDIPPHTNKKKQIIKPTFPGNNLHGKKYSLNRFQGT